MGIADFAFSAGVRLRKKKTDEATEITLEPRGASVVAKNPSGQELFSLRADGSGEYSMLDTSGHPVLSTKKDADKPDIYHIYDKEMRRIGQTAHGSFQWESTTVAWTAKSIGLITDALMVAHKGIDAPDAAQFTEETLMAEVKMASAKSSGYLKVPAEVLKSPGNPPLGLFLFEAMVLNLAYIKSSTLQRLSLTSSYRKV